MKFENNKQKRDYMISKANDRLGETNLNKSGSKMWIIRYGNANDIDVEFENGYVIKNRTYKLFKDGVMKSPYDTSVYGHGYLGEGKYSIYNGERHVEEYITWKSMLGRCYSSKYQEKQPTYKDCKVCDEWLNFQNFAEWYHCNYYVIGNARMQLDKDILIKGNKIYSPETCIFVPSFINNLFTKSNASRGSLPIGVAYSKGKFQAYSNDGYKNRKHLGYHETVEDAFNAYKTYKEQLLKDIANKYKGLIPNNLYQSLINYKVNIED